MATASRGSLIGGYGQGRRTETKTRGPCQRSKVSLTVAATSVVTAAATTGIVAVATKVKCGRSA